MIVNYETPLEELAIKFNNIEAVKKFSLSVLKFFKTKKWKIDENIGEIWHQGYSKKE